MPFFPASLVEIIPNNYGVILGAWEKGESFNVEEKLTQGR